MKFNKITCIFVAIVASFTMCTNVAYASPWVIDALYADDPIIDPQVTTIQEGEPAPFDGVVMNNAAAAQISVDKANAGIQCEIETKRVLEIQHAELQLKIDNLRAANTSYIERMKLDERLNEKSIASLSKELERSQKQALGGRWNALYYVGGVATGVLMIVVGAYAVRGIRETNL